MGIRLTVAGADFSGSAVAFAPPITRGLRYWNYFNGEQKIGRNLTLGGPKPAIGGTPTQGAGFATFEGTGEYIETGVAQIAEQTLLIVPRWLTPVAASNNSAIGRFAAVPGSSPNRFNGNQIYWSAAAGRIIATDGRLNGTSASTLFHQLPVEATPDVFSFYAFRSGTDVSRFEDVTREHVVSAVPPYPPDPTGLSIRVGAVTGGAVATDVDIAYAAIFDVVLTDEEIAATYAAVKKYLATLAIAI